MIQKHSTIEMQSFQPAMVSSLRYCRRFPIPSLHVLECSFHVGHKHVMANVSMTRGARFEGKIIIFGVGIKSHLTYGEIHPPKVNVKEKGAN